MEETQLALIALSHDMYEYILSVCLIEQSKYSEEIRLFGSGAFFVVFSFYKNETIDTNDHNVLALSFYWTATVV